jgi:hypothetical protein
VPDQTTIAAVPAPPTTATSPGLAPFSLHEDAFGRGWADWVLYPHALCPTLALKVMAPSDSQRRQKSHAAGFTKLFEELIPEAQNIAKANAEIAAAEAASSSALHDSDDEAAARQLGHAQLRRMRAERALRDAEREANETRDAIAPLIETADRALLQYARSACSNRGRRMQDELRRLVESLPGEIMGKILVLHLATQGVQLGGDMMFHRLRDLLGKDLPNPDLSEKPDEIDPEIAAANFRRTHPDNEPLPPGRFVTEVHDEQLPDGSNHHTEEDRFVPDPPSSVREFRQVPVVSETKADGVTVKSLRYVDVDQAGKPIGGQRVVDPQALLESYESGAITAEEFAERSA